MIAPSNPYVSDPPGSLPSLPSGRRSSAAELAALPVSPLVGGRAVKGPADRMLRRMGGGAEPRHVAQCYEGLIDALVVDESDLPAQAAVPLVGAHSLMTNLEASRRLAAAVLEVAA